MEKIIAICICLIGATSGSTWNYNSTHGPSHWSDDYPLCAGTAQSPVDIDTDDVEYGDSLGTFTFTGYSGPFTDDYFTMVNNGHTVEVSLNNNEPNVSGAGLDGTYRLMQFHIHWGSVSSQGSEHTVNGDHYAAEIHFVHIKSSYDTIASAKLVSEGIAVLGVFVEESSSAGSDYDSVTDNLASLVTPDTYLNISSFALDALFPDDTDRFYRYEGSLTTPTCNEAVVWTLFAEPVKMTSAQLNLLRNLDDSEGEKLEDNYRPTQSINGRTISFSAAPAIIATHSTLCIAIIMMLYHLYV